MPTSLAAVLTLVLAIIPGSLGAYLFARIRGTDWHTKDWQAAVQHVAFSLAGLLIYVSLASAFGLPRAEHVIPATYVNLQGSTLHELIVPYASHWMFSGLAGVLAAYVDLLAFKSVGHTRREPAWDAFANSLHERWVVVSLKSGDAYHGYVARVDVGLPAAERDLILREPTRYEATKEDFVPSGYRDLFIPAATVDSIGIVSESGDDALTQTQQPLLEERPDDHTNGTGTPAQHASPRRDQARQRRPQAAAKGARRQAAKAAHHAAKKGRVRRGAR